MRRDLARRSGKELRSGGDSYSYVVADNLRFLNGADWDGITDGQSLFLSRAYQSALRNAAPRGLQTRYGLIYAPEKPVAAVVAHVLTMDADARAQGDPWTPDSPLRDSISGGSDLVRYARRELPQTRKLLICGDPFAAGFHGVATHPNADLGLLWPAIAGFLERVQHQERFDADQDCVFIKDVHATLEFDTRALRACHYRRLNASSAMHFSMPARWTCFEDYVSHLNIRHRMGAYRVSRDLARAGIESRTIETLAPWAERIHELYLSVQRTDGRALATLPPEFMPALTQSLGRDGFRCTGLFQGAELVACVTTLRDRQRAVCFCLGWDRERCAGIPMLSALLHASIADALALGCHEIDFGRTALKAKAQVGAHPQASDVWVKQTSLQPPNWLQAAVEPLSHSPVPDPVLSLAL